MLFFDSSQLLVLLAFMLMIDVIDCIMLIRGKQSIWTFAAICLIISFIVADALIAWKVAKDEK